jgi:hypothetical protein
MRTFMVSKEAKLYIELKKTFLIKNCTENKLSTKKDALKNNFGFLFKEKTV